MDVLGRHIGVKMTPTSEVSVVPVILTGTRLLRASMPAAQRKLDEDMDVLGRHVGVIMPPTSGASG